MTTSSNKTRARFSYIYYSIDTRNQRELEAHVKKDAEGNILTRRKKEDTATNTKDYNWEIYWLVRSVGKRGSGVVVR